MTDPTLRNRRPQADGGPPVEPRPATSPAIRRPLDVSRLGTVLGVWAHPDDEAYLSGGLMALAAGFGQRVVCVTATRGELGTPDSKAWPPHRLATERTAELARCLAVLGVSEHHWLGYRDGECPAVPVQGPVGRLCDVIDAVRPDTVLTFGPDGITGHPDHRTVSAWTTAAFDRAAPEGARLLYSAVPEWRVARWKALDDSVGVYLPGYPVTTPPESLTIELELPSDVLARKVRALSAQTTQTAGLIAAMGLDRYTAWVADECFVAGGQAAPVVERPAAAVTPR